MRVDYPGFAAGYGADFGQRLRLVSCPACPLSTDRPEFRLASPLDFENTAKRYAVGEVTLPSEHAGGEAVVA